MSFFESSAQIFGAAVLILGLILMVIGTTKKELGPTLIGIAFIFGGGAILGGATFGWWSLL
ncbi:MAG: hypothetical protein V1807_02530 [Patescibacteria group bacterium]